MPFDDVRIVQRMLDENSMTLDRAFKALVRIVKQQRQAQEAQAAKPPVEPTAESMGKPAPPPRFGGLTIVNDVQRARESTACPRCGAEPGSPCRMPSGQPITTHQVRVDVYRAALQTKGKSARRQKAA